LPFWPLQAVNKAVIKDTDLIEILQQAGFPQEKNYGYSLNQRVTI
jgi:hypothetical protein